MRSLFGHPSGNWQVFGIFGGVITGGGLGWATLFVLFWERPLRRMMGTGGGGDGELSLCKIPTRRKFNCSVSD